MKYINKLNRFTLILSIGLIILATGCGEEKTPQELNTEKLSNGGLGWETVGGSVFINSLDYSSEWDDFKINFSNQTYTTSGGPDGVFRSNGSWEYLDESTITEIVLDTEITVFLQLTDTSLELRFTLPYQTTRGRVAVLGGTYQIELSKVTN